MKEHIFWNTQPIDISKNSIESKSIKEYNINEIKKEPFPLPDNFEWTLIDLTNDEQLTLFQIFLSNYYYYDDKEPNRYVNYSKDILKWFLMPPNYYPDLIIGVKYKNKLLATICGIPMKVNLFNKIIDIIEINFLCIHPKLRNKNLAPLMIKEITRRINLHQIWQAFYTGTNDLPNNLVQLGCYMKPLNLEKLKETDGLSYNLTPLIKTLNIRKLEERDCEICCNIMNKFNEKFKLSIYFTLEYFKQHFLPIDSYVVEINNEITDFISFYNVPIIIKNNKINQINKYNLYYYFYTETKLKTLIENGLYLLKEKGADLVSCLENYDNESFVNELNFIKGRTVLNFYLYNWTCTNINNNEMSIIMV